MYNIDCKLLMEALDYYRDLNYVPLSAPMLVDKDVVEITLPEDRKAKEHLGKYYVGSAEQSFYQLVKNGLKPVGSYMLITPCERDEVLSESHLNIFLKIELISMNKNREDILEDVLLFYADNKINTEVIDTLTGYDINVNNIEVGSFGDRITKDGWVSYGTGLALPRISYALEQDFGL